MDRSVPGEERFRTLAASAPVGIFEMDASGDCIFVNPRCCELTGFAAEELAGRGWIAALHPEDRERVVAAWYDTAASGAEFVSEFRVRTPAGRDVSLFCRASPHRDPEGNLTGFVGTLIDVTDRRQAEDVLRESEARLSAIIASASDAIVTVDADHRIVVFNRAAELMFGCGASDAIGQRLDRFIPEESGAHVWHSGETFVPFRPMDGEGVRTARRASGEPFPIEAQISQTTVRGANLYTVIIRDVTERRRAEAERDELLRREREARERAEAATDLLHRVQRIADATIPNLSLDELLAELLARVRTVLGTDTAVVLLREGDVLRVRAAIGLEEEVRANVRVPIGQGFAGRIAAEGRPVILEHVDYDGVVSRYIREKAIRSLAGVPLEVDGRVIGVLHTGSFRPRRFTDDEVRVLELARERIATAIERVAAHEAERRAREAAEAANQTKDEFLSTVSHELRTPLAAMLGWVRLMRDGKLSGERVARALDIIDRSGRSQARLIDDLLDVSRIVSGRLGIDLRPVELRAIVETAMETLRTMADQKGVVVALHLPADPVGMVGDAGRLQQVVWNLLSNAVKFTPGGGRVDVELTREGSMARLVVRDTGRGIAAAFLPHVFEAFRQAESVRTRHRGGLGLGLSISRRLVELHGGTIAAESGGEGQGATVTVVLPVPAHAAAPAAAPPVSGDRRLHGVRVLLVDDDADTRAVFREILELHGASVTTAATVAEARGALRTEDPDVLVTDIRLPDADGYVLVRELRETGRRPGLPAVAVTAYAAEENEGRARAAGFHAHFGKPVEPTRLVAAIAELALAAASAN